MANRNPLDDLRDIHLPAAPAGLPDWLLLGVAALALVSALVLAAALWSARSPERREIRAILHSIASLEGPQALAAMAALLRRLALAKGARDAALLSGGAWLAHLDQIFATRFFSEGAGQVFGERLYSAAPGVDVHALANQLRPVILRPWWRPW